ncbi:MAG: radical SAM protein [Polyangiaceae bacterium]|nr:radical SAM protein [Polyangiaceae bacterium]
MNFHILSACDARCDFCFATFPGVRGRLAAPDARRLITLLRAHGAEKLTFAGGEPTLHPDLEGYLRHAKGEGLVTGVVTNGSRLQPLLARAADAIDWVALSVDSASEATQRALGRGGGDHVARAVRLSDLCRAAGVRLKVNTVVTSLTWEEDLTELLRRLAPERWKLFQVLRVEGQNDGRVERLLISREQFSAFVARHARLAEAGVTLVPEDNDAITDSYVMIDPLGRLYGDTGGIHRVGPSVLEAGVDAALAAVGFQPEKLRARGGLYDWAPPRRHLPILAGRPTRPPRAGGGYPPG